MCATRREGRDSLGGLRDPLNRLAANFKEISLIFFQITEFARGRCSKHGLIVVMNGGCHGHAFMIKILQVKGHYMAAMFMTKLC